MLGVQEIFKNLLKHETANKKLYENITSEVKHLVCPLVVRCRINYKPLPFLIFRQDTGQCRVYIK